MAKSETTGMPGMDQDWAAENDARTLMEAEKIKADPKRAKMAQAKCDEMATAAAKASMSTRLNKILK